jgi:myo-inositol-1(or 4)-monophosphatase
MKSMEWLAERMSGGRRSVPVLPFESDVPGILAILHAELRQELQAWKDRPDPGRRNAKGDLQRSFDLAADEYVRSYLERAFPAGVLLSEESGERRFGRGKLQYRFVVDPVDGSDNYSRRLPLAALSIAVLPAEAPLSPEEVLFSMVADLLRDESPILAARGEGAYRGSTRLKTSSVGRLSEAFISCELNHFAPPPQLGKLLSRARGVRVYGCCSLALGLVASGAIDAHVDVRDRLTLESFLAASRAVEEAGGCVVNRKGNPLGALTGLEQRTSLIAAASSELAKEIVNVLDSSDY